MAFGDGLSGIENQLVPDIFGQALSQTAPGAGLETLSVQQPQVPTQLQEPNFTLTPENSKRVKGLGKFISNLGDVLADPATQKALASIGIGLDPRGVGGVLGNFGISLAEENARDEFRAAIAAGGDPNQISISGLSTQGRQAVLNEGLQAQEASRDERLLQLREDDQTFDQEIQRIRIGLEEERLAQQERSIQVREDELEVSREVRTRELELSATRTELDRIRTQVQNTADLARIEAAKLESEARTDRANTDSLIKLNQQRGKQVEGLVEIEQDLQGKLRTAQQNLEEVQGRRGKLFGAASDEELVAATQAVAQIETQLSEARTLREGLLNDISTDLAAESERIRGTLSGSESTAGTQLQTPRAPTSNATIGDIPVVRTPEEFGRIKEGQQFFMPDPQTKRPILVQMDNGVPRRVIQ